MAAKKRARGALGDPTTVRFPKELDRFLREEGAKYRGGMAGLIRDACAELMQRKQNTKTGLRAAMMGIE